ncbi:AfsR/SARP family transcriptional regulator [Streptomyces telluris]|uniref:SARP family transcriptional regulator n=2 Tax=Streptomyces telluris TaxID=2720021 RepID=A0A9X2RJ79_9ACTN|nr:BTAD domain-containing putative transcriptional regulator [Streptomyces telluris]MCQ8768388.1 SARP family transcriptional regulator [Streptomyces telluris]
MPSRDEGATLRIALLCGFRLAAGDVLVRIPAGSERLLAYVALRPGGVARSAVAENLWPDVSEARAHAALRSALNRLRGAGCRRVLDIGPAELALAEGVAVDLHGFRSLARAVLDGPESARAGAGDPGTRDVGSREIEGLSQDLLPGWCDEWALREAEEWRQLRLHALEALARRFVRTRHFAHAVSAAGAAVRADPLRESARAALIAAHLAEGNQSEALREFRQYRSLLRSELGLRPTPDLLGLVAGLRPAASGVDGHQRRGHAAVTVRRP